MNCTVVVCGGGMAGISAALAAQEAGAEVTVLDKAPVLGGSARMSGGFVWSYKRLDDLYDDMDGGNAVLQRAVVESRLADVEWLSGLGVPFSVQDPFLEKGTAHVMEPVAAFARLHSLFTERGGTVLTSTALERLVIDAGRCSGVVTLRAGGGSSTIAADAVVLATGGFQGNPELVRRLTDVDPDALYLRSNPWSTGDGFLAATSAGAAVSGGLGTFYGHAMVAEPARFPPDRFAEASQYYATMGVALNLAGHRFADESAGSGEEVLNQAVARQPGARAVYVLDSSIAAGEALAHVMVTSVVLERARSFGATVHAGSTLDELVEVIEAAEGIPAPTALASLSSFNQAVAENSALAPPRRRHRRPLDTPPYFAVGVRAGITFTMGGLAVDPAMRVLRRCTSTSALATLVVDVDDVRQDPIPGLFAAGVDVGDIWTGSYAGGLSLALVTGRMAGRNAAASDRGKTL